MGALLPVFVGVYYLSYWLRFEGQLGPTELNRFWGTAVWVVAVKLMLFGWFRIYQGWGRFVTFYDLVALVQAATTSLLMSVLINRFFVVEPFIPVVFFSWIGEPPLSAWVEFGRFCE